MGNLSDTNITIPFEHMKGFMSITYFTSAAGGNANDNAWRVINQNTNATIVLNGITGASYSGNQVTLPVGHYIMRYNRSFSVTNYTQFALYNVTDAVYTYGPSCKMGNSSATFDNNVIVFETPIEVVTSSKVFEMRYKCRVDRATDGMGRDMGSDNCHGQWVIMQVKVG